jgi:hypothetical protein
MSRTTIHLLRFAKIAQAPNNPSLPPLHEHKFC